jgi:hypothetical protein
MFLDNNMEITHTYDVEDIRLLVFVFHFFSDHLSASYHSHYFSFLILSAVAPLTFSGNIDVKLRLRRTRL